MGHCQSKRKTVEEKFAKARDHGDDQAVQSWTRALQKTTDDEEKFILYKLLIELFEERGLFRSMVGYSVKQFDLVKNSTHRDKVLLASLNLARAKLFLGEHQDAAKMANYSLSMLENVELNSSSYRRKVDALLTAGAANLGCSKYSASLGHLDATLRLAHVYADKIVEALACCCLSSLYYQVRDDEKGSFYPMKAESLMARYGENWDSKTKCTVMIAMAVSERKNGKLDSAMARCEEAMTIAMEKHDRASQAYCILTFADIHRQRADNDRAIPRYNATIKMFRDIGDKFGLIQAQIGVAKCLAQCKRFRDSMNSYQLAVTSCHETDNKSYEIKIYEDLIAINKFHGSDDAIQRFTKLREDAIQQMNVRCGYCLEYIGGKVVKLEALSCTHFFHTRCVEGGITVCKCCQQQVTYLRPVN